MVPRVQPNQVLQWTNEFEVRYFVPRSRRMKMNFAGSSWIVSADYNNEGT